MPVVFFMSYRYDMMLRGSKSSETSGVKPENYTLPALWIRINRPFVIVRCCFCIINRSVVQKLVETLVMIGFLGWVRPFWSEHTKISNSGMRTGQSWGLTTKGWLVQASMLGRVESLLSSPRPGPYRDHKRIPKQTKPDPPQLHFPSATSHQSVKRLQAVWLVGNEIGFTLERTRRTELLFLMGSRARRWSRRWGPTCR